MKNHTPSFDLVVINPDIIIGPMIHPIQGSKSINETNHFAISSFVDGTHKQIEGVTFPFYHFVCHDLPSNTKLAQPVYDQRYMTDTMSRWTFGT